MNAAEPFPTEVLAPLVDLVVTSDSTPMLDNCLAVAHATLQNEADVFASPDLRFMRPTNKDRSLRLLRNLGLVTPYHHTPTEILLPVLQLANTLVTRKLVTHGHGGFDDIQSVARNVAYSALTLEKTTDSARQPYAAATICYMGLQGIIAMRYGNNSYGSMLSANTF